MPSHALSSAMYPIIFMVIWRKLLFYCSQLINVRYQIGYLFFLIQFTVFQRFMDCFGNFICYMQQLFFALARNGNYSFISLVSCFPIKSYTFFGFWCFLVSNVLWIIRGWQMRVYVLILLQFVLVLLNIRGIYKNLIDN